MRRACQERVSFPLIFAVLCALLLSCIPLLASAQSGGSSLLVKLVDGLSPALQADVIARNGGIEISSIPALRLHVIQVVTADLPQVLANYKADPQVVNAEENQTRQSQAFPAVLYVWNVEPAQRVVAPSPAAPQMSVARPPAPYSDLIRAAATRHGLAPELVEAVVRVESNFDARAISKQGARGLMQLMPSTAAQLGVRDVFDVRQNIEGGVRHLRYLVDRYKGNLTLALAAYNAGVDAVARHGGVPPYTETQAYVTRVLRLLQRTGPSVGAETAETLEPKAIGILRRYGTVHGRFVYSNPPSNQLSVTVREMMAERQ